MADLALITLCALLWLLGSWLYWTLLQYFETPAEQKSAQQDPILGDKNKKLSYFSAVDFSSFASAFPKGGNVSQMAQEKVTLAIDMRLSHCSRSHRSRGFQLSNKVRKPRPLPNRPFLLTRIRTRLSQTSEGYQQEVASQSCERDDSNGNAAEQHSIGTKILKRMGNSPFFNLPPEVCSHRLIISVWRKLNVKTYRFARKSITYLSGAKNPKQSLLHFAVLSRRFL